MHDPHPVLRRSHLAERKVLGRGPRSPPGRGVCSHDEKASACVYRLAHQRAKIPLERDHDGDVSRGELEDDRDLTRQGVFGHLIEHRNPLEKPAAGNVLAERNPVSFLIAACHLTRRIDVERHHPVEAFGDIVVHSRDDVCRGGAG